jgi:hypothetical protein
MRVILSLMLLGCLLPREAPAGQQKPTPHVQAVATLEKLGATVENAKNARGEPVVHVNLSACETLDAALPHLHAVQGLEFLDL